MEYLVTGGAGFIGSNLVDALVAQGHEVTVWDSLTTGKRTNVNEKAKFHEIDVTRVHPEYHTEIKYDAIFHLAAEARIQPSFIYPMRAHDSNVTGTARILEIARNIRAKVVLAGTSSLYHDPYANPYTFTKGLSEQYCRLYNQVYNVSVAICRFFNVYGPRQLDEGAYATVIGIFDRQKREGRPLTITGTGEQRRDFTHVDDIVAGLISAARDRWNGEVFNFGTGRNHSINELAAMYNHPTVYVEARPGEAKTTLADIEFSKAALGFEPKRRLEDYFG